MNRILVATHRYTALGIGAFVAMMGLTGASLVLRGEVEDRSHPERLLAPGDRTFSYEAVLRTSRAAQPHANRYSIYPGDAAHTFRVEAEGVERRLLFIDPRNGRLVAEVGSTEYLFDWIERLHTHLLSGDTGEMVVACIGLMLMVLGVTGIVQAWPRRLSLAFRIRWDAKSPWLAYDLHRVIGLVAGLFLLVNATTGIVLVFAGTAARVVNSFTHSPPPVYTVLPQASAGRDRAPLDDVVRAAERAIPGARASRIVVRPGNAPVVVRLHTDSDRHPQGLSTVTVDPYDATPMAVAPLAAQPAGQRMFDWLFALHVGELLGTPYRVFLVLVGLAPTLLLGTGLVVWTRRRKTRGNGRAAIQ